MKLTTAKSIKLALFAILGIAILGYAIYTIGKQRNLFGNNITVTGVFKDVSGLKIGNNVRFSGINVGTVSDIRIISDSLVQVELTIEKKVTEFIRQDSRMEISTEGLMGNKVISITPGSRNKPTIQNGDEIKTIEAVQIDEIMEELKNSSVNTSRVTENLAEITDKINQGEGVFGKLFTDTTFTNNLDRISRNTAGLTKNVTKITEKVNQEQGIIGKLLSDTTVANRFSQAGENLLESTENLKEITNKINKGEGVFGKMYTDTSFTKNLDKASKNINYTSERAKEISDNLVKITEDISRGKGFINKLLTDSIFADSLEQTILQIDKSAKELDKAAKTVRKNWFIRTFSSNKEEKEPSKEEKEENPEPQENK